jgi:beta-lactamase regulating signal transducer with metallopeptidase domain
MTREAKTTSPRQSTRPAGFGWWNFGFRQGEGLSSQAATLVLAVILAIWLVAAAYLVLVSQTMVAARRVQLLRDELSYWQEQNAHLEEQIATRVDVRELMRSAESQGLVFPAAQVDFVEP